MEEIFMDILERFLKYVAIDTTSNPLKEENPSSENQKDLAEILVKELTDLGIEVYYDNKHCYVYAKCLVTAIYQVLVLYHI